jgi:hypothetical protein
MPSPIVSVDDAAAQLEEYIRSLQHLVLVEPTAGYEHMGAVITDAVLQPGVSYHKVVVPKVNRLLERYPQARTTSAFAEVLARNGPEKVLGWRGGHKPEIAVALTELLRTAGVETVADLREWAHGAAPRAELMQIRGVGPKTADYLALLAGRTDLVAVDQHLMTFLKDAGISPASYTEAKTILVAAAARMQLSPAALDHSIWQYVTQGLRGDARAAWTERSG